MSVIKNTPLTTHKIVPAVGFMMMSVALYALQDVLVKLLPPQISLVQITFFRGVFAFIPIFFFSFAEQRLRKECRIFHSTQWQAHFWRSFFSFLALLCFIGAFRLIPLAEAYSLTFSCPFFLTLLSAPYLKEKVSLQRWIAVIFGFIGILVMLRPGNIQLGGIIALMGGFVYAISLLLVRKLSAQDSNSLITLTFTALTVVLTAPLLPFFWSAFDLHYYLYLIAIGVLGGSAQLAMTQAFRMGEVSAVAPFDYIALIWAVGFGYFIWGELPDRWIVLGASIIVLSGLYLIRSEKKQEHKTPSWRAPVKGVAI